MAWQEIMLDLTDAVEFRSLALTAVKWITFAAGITDDGSTKALALEDIESAEESIAAMKSILEKYEDRWVEGDSDLFE